jgi:diadenosine tetraphosphate (Ap4A) HIT family hydrolase
MCGPGAAETSDGLRIFEGAWADGYIGRRPVRPGYAYVIWRGPHVSEPTELSPEEAAGFWSEVALVARAVDEEYKPAKMNWFSLGNGVPHLHVHLVPRPPDDARPGRPVESEAFDFAAIPPAEPAQLAAAAAALRTRLRELT